MDPGRPIVKASTMSMELLLVKLTPSQADTVVASPAILRDIFEDDVDALVPPLSLLDFEADILDLNYLHISRYLDTEAEEGPWMRKAANGAGTSLEFDFGYGNGWLVRPPEVREIASGIEQDGWFDPDPDLSGDILALATFYRTAAEQGRVIIGGIA
jgi:hypothetical protein